MHFLVTLTSSSVEASILTTLLVDRSKKKRSTKKFGVGFNWKKPNSKYPWNLLLGWLPVMIFVVTRQLNGTIVSKGVLKKNICLCCMQKKIKPTPGFEPGILWLEVKSDNHFATQAFRRFWLILINTYLVIWEKDIEPKYLKCVLI